MTLIDVFILIIVIAAAVAGFRRLGGSHRAGALLGLLVGAGVCSAFGARLAGLGSDESTRRVLMVIGIVGGLLIGAAVGGFLGGLLTRVLVAGRLGFVDRVIGALAGAASALLVVWLLGAVLPAVIGPGPLEPITALLAPLGGHSAVVDAIGRSLPSTAADVRSVLPGVPAR
jgi:uncharacterized membrane protein required for colicin V production